MRSRICIQRAPLGTHERFIGFLMEHYAGNLLLYLNAEHVRVPRIGDETALVDYARAIQTELRAGRVANAEQMKVHTILVVRNRVWKPTPSACGFTA